MARILLVRPNSDIYCAPIPLGLMYLSSYLKVRNSSHTIRILDGRAENIRDENRYIKIILDYNPDIIGICALHHEAKASKHLAKLIKRTKRDCMVVVGGPYPSSDYEMCLRCDDIDFAVVGEGEETFFELVKSIENNTPLENITGIAYRKNGNVIFNGIRESIEDVDKIPYPDYSQIDINSYFYGSRPGLTNPVYREKRGISVITSRGCPYQCTYCHKIFGKNIRMRSVENVLGEIFLLKQKYNVEEIEFLDDCFNLNLERAKKILDCLIKSGMDLKISFPNGLRIDRMDEEFIDKLKEANVYRISFGIETANLRIQSEIKKEIDLIKAKEIIKMTTERNIHTTGFFMLGFPNETEEEMNTTINYALATSLSTASFYIVTPYPGTEIWKAARYKNALLDRNDDIYADRDEISINLSCVSDYRLYQLRKMAYRKFYFNIKRILIILKFIRGKRHIFYSIIRIILLSIKGKSS